MKFSKVDTKIYTRLIRHAKRYDVSIIRVWEAYQQNLSQERKQHPEWDENSQKNIAYRKTLTWMVKSYSYAENNQCKDCYTQMSSRGCQLYRELSELLMKVGPLTIFQETLSPQEIKKICKLEDKTIKCRRRKTYSHCDKEPEFRHNTFVQNPRNSKKVNKPAIHENQVSLQEYCS